MRRLSIALLALTALATLGCATRTVYVVRDNEPAPRYYDDRRTAEPAQSYDYSRDAFRDPPPVSSGYSQVDQFYTQLRPYGNFVQHRRYGNVFVPHRHLVGPNFRPYTRGQWQYTQYGWTFDSSLPFGGVTAHYGRWFYDTRLGWAWVPDTQWGPAWVTWRRGGGYIGWAPLPPGASFGGSYSVYRTSWTFVSTNRFGSSGVYSYVVTGPGYNDCYSRTSPYRETVTVRDRRYYRGPSPDNVSRDGGRVVHRPVNDRDRGPTARDRAGDRSDDRRDHNGRNTARERDRTDVRGDRGTEVRTDTGVRRDRDEADTGYRNRPRRTETVIDDARPNPRAPQKDRFELGEREAGVRADPRKDRYDLGEREAGVRNDPKDIYNLGDRDPGIRADPRRKPVDRDNVRGPVRVRTNSPQSDVRVRGGREEVRVPAYEDSRSPDENPYLLPGRTPATNSPRPDPRMTRPAPSNRDLRAPAAGVRGPTTGVQRATPTVISTPTRTGREDPRATTTTTTRSSKDTKNSSSNKSSSKKSSSKKK